METEDHAFKAGDRVCLNSGGPVMTVRQVRGDGALECTWFPERNSGEVSLSVFPAACVRPVA